MSGTIRQTCTNWLPANQMFEASQNVVPAQPRLQRADRLRAWDLDQ